MICGLMELAFQFERKMIKHVISIKWEKFCNREDVLRAEEGNREAKGCLH